jgi:hypothetical protein
MSPDAAIAGGSFAGRFTAPRAAPASPVFAH